MKPYIFVSEVVLIVLAVCQLSGSATAGEYVPFNGRFEGFVTSPPFVPPIVFEIEGTATRLGQFQLTNVVFPNPVTRTGTGSLEFVAANGDKLTATSRGQSTDTAAPGVVIVVETATITGGTGQFSDATGTFGLTRLFNVNSGTTVGSFSGNISSVGMKR